MQRLSSTWLACVIGIFLLVPTPSRAGGIRTVSGKLRAIRENAVTIENPGLFSASTVEIEMNEATRKSGQLAPGMHVKVKYREEDGRKIALEITARPEHASKAAKKAATQTRP